MVVVCPHCARANSAAARFCHYDGVSLLGNGQAPAAARHTFLTPFVFSSGRECTTYDDFAQACLQHWEEAVQLLQKGFLQSFFGGMGRMDLMLAAQEAAAFPDHDRGLDLLLSRLPTQSLPAPKLDVQPKLIDLGTRKFGQNSQFELHLDNKGNRLVFGSISSTSKWLAVTDTGEEARLFQIRHSSQLTIQVKGQHLRAALKPLEGSLLVETNAGVFNLKVIVQVAIQPYPDGVLAGARTPRELAEKAKHAPRQAAPFFECGAVAKWYQSNGWTYPVQGPSANGLAAVQQFFEALGVSKPPTVRVSDQRLFLKGKPGEKVLHRLQLHGEENRPIYVHAISPAPWLVVRPALLQGTSATLPIEIAVPQNAGETLQTTLKIQANGNQQFEVPVMVAVEAEEEAAAAIPPPRVERSVRPSRPAGAGKLLWHALPVGMLGLLLLGLVTTDALRVKTDVPLVQEEPQEELHATLAKEAPFKVAIEDEPVEQPAVPVARFKIEDEPEERFLKLPPPPVKVEIKDEPEAEQPQLAPIAVAPLVTYMYGNLPSRFGMSCTSAAGAASNKLLTYSGTGDTNSTVVKLGGRARVFGGAAGQWTRINKSLLGVPATAGGVRPSQSTWVCDRMIFHQVLEVVPGQPVTVGGTSRRQLDSVLVRWLIQNDSRTPRPVGLRLQLDTLIGGNDGVPFTVPGYTGLVSTFADFRQAKDVPDFIQALEFPSLRNPGTVAHLTLKVGGNIEPPGRVSLTRWPGVTSAWEVPVLSLAQDSAVVLYWPEKTLKAGATRTIGFAYGLGQVSSNDKLGVTLGGSFEPGQHFTVSAYVEHPVAGQTLRLELPAGLRRVDGTAIQKVSLGSGSGRNTSIVTWKVQVERTGEFRLKVHSSTGLSQAKTISIAQGTAPTGGKLSLELQGAFEPGQTFTVKAKVHEPLDKQTLTLYVPAGLENITGEFTQLVPAPRAGLQDSFVQWQVRVKEAGKYPVRVSSSTGVAQTKTITIVQPSRAEGSFQILLRGDFAPGKIFTVSSRVVNPAPEQRLTLVLPAGLERIDSAETQVVQAGAPMTWQVKILEAGKFTVGVKSTTGVTQRKTLRIEPDGDLRGGRFQFELAGEIRPGKEFDVIAQVTNPLAGQTLTLLLPKELQRVGGEATQNVPTPAQGVGTVAWKVRVVESGSLRVRVASSTGVTRAKTIHLTSPKNQPLFTR